MSRYYLSEIWHCQTTCTSGKWTDTSKIKSCAFDHLLAHFIVRCRHAKLGKWKEFSLARSAKLPSNFSYNYAKHMLLWSIAFFRSRQAILLVACLQRLTIVSSCHAFSWCSCEHRSYCMMGWFRKLIVLRRKIVSRKRWADWSCQCSVAGEHFSCFWRLIRRKCLLFSRATASPDRYLRMRALR